MPPLRSLGEGMQSFGMESFRELFLMGLVSLKMTEIFLAWVPASSGCHWECQADRFKSSISFLFLIRWSVGGKGAQSKTEWRRKNETRMERRRDRGAGGQKEQVVRREGLMSNERLTRPQLILSLYLCFGVSLSTNVKTTPSSIILLSPVIHWELLNNMLQIRPPSYNSFCHLQYIIWKTHRLLSAGRSLRIITCDTFGMQPESGASLLQA